MTPLPARLASRPIARQFEERNFGGSGNARTAAVRGPKGRKQIIARAPGRHEAGTRGSLTSARSAALNLHDGHAENHFSSLPRRISSGIDANPDLRRYPRRNDR